MSPVAAIVTEAAARVILTEFVAWQERKARDANWKPSAADVEEFFGRVDADTPAAIEAEARQELKG